MGHTLLPTTGKGTRDGRGRAYAPSGRGNPPKVVPPHQPQQATGWARAVATFPRHLEDGCSQSSALGSTHSRRPQRRSQPAAATHGRHYGRRHPLTQPIPFGKEHGWTRGGGKRGGGRQGRAKRAAPSPNLGPRLHPFPGQRGSFQCAWPGGTLFTATATGRRKGKETQSKGEECGTGGYCAPHTARTMCRLLLGRSGSRGRAYAAHMSAAAASGGDGHGGGGGSSDDMWQRPEGGTPVAAATVAAVAVAGASTAAGSGSDGSGRGSRRG